MSLPVSLTFADTAEAGDDAALIAATGRIAILMAPTGRPSGAARRLDRRMRGAISRALAARAWEALKPGEALDLGYPSGLQAEAVQVVKLPRRATVAEARKAGAAIAGAARAARWCWRRGRRGSPRSRWGWCCAPMTSPRHKTAEAEAEGRGHLPDRQGRGGATPPSRRSRRRPRASASPATWSTSRPTC